MKKSLFALATLVLAVSCAPEFNPFTSGMSGTISGAATWAEGADFVYFAGTQAQEFTLASGAGSQTAKFSPAGEIAAVEEVAGAVAVAPAFDNASASYDGTTATVVANFPKTQTIAALGQYPAGTMVAVASKDTENLTFLPAYGILAVKIAGDNVNITKVEVTANGKETINGTAEITVEGGAISDVEMLEDGDNVVTLDCGEAGLTVSKVAKDFYVLVPAGTYSKGFNVVLTAADGAQNTIEGADAVTVTAGKATQLANISFAPFVNLNETAEPANCYVITKGGSYYFDATVKGNGKAGIYKGFPDQNPNIEPVGAKVVWSEVENLVTNPFIKDGKLYFSCSGKDGNALVAATDADDNILWSWHIWSTVAPAEISVLDGRYVFMDRNLGAYTKEDTGFYYEAGRKDPFVGEGNTVCDPRHTFDWEIITWTNEGHTERIEENWGIQPAEFHSIAFSIAHPNAYIPTSALTDNNGTWYWLMDSVPGDNYKEYTQWLWGKSHYYYNKVDSSIEDGNQPYAAFKSIYDPCPAGYMVCTPSALADGGVSTPDGSRATWTKNGASLYDGKVILPHSGFLYNVGSFGWDFEDHDGDGVNDWVGLWTCEAGWSTENPSGFFRLQCGDGDCRNVYGPAAAHPVRCMKAVFNGDKQTIE